MVSTDTWARGWSVTIDGEPSTVLKVNSTIRGVMIPIGAHYVKWTYRPAFWEITRWIMLVGMALAAGMISLPAWIQWRHQTNRAMAIDHRRLTTVQANTHSQPQQATPK